MISTNKFAIPHCDLKWPKEHTVSNNDPLSEKELDDALFSTKLGKTPGWVEITEEV